MSYVIKSNNFKIYISEQNNTTKYCRTQPRIESCEQSKFFDDKHKIFPILTFGVASTDNLTISICFTTAGKKLNFSTDKYTKTGTLMNVVECPPDVQITSIFQKHLGSVIPNLSNTRGQKPDNGMVIWVDGNPFGIFCRLQDLNIEELSGNSLNIFGLHTTCTRGTALIALPFDLALKTSLENIESRIGKMDQHIEEMLENIDTNIDNTLEKMDANIERLLEKMDGMCGRNCDCVTIPMAHRYNGE